jgi:hypothetical protein
MHRHQLCAQAKGTCACACCRPRHAADAATMQQATNPMRRHAKSTRQSRGRIASQLAPQLIQSHTACRHSKVVPRPDGVWSRVDGVCEHGAQYFEQDGCNSHSARTPVQAAVGHLLPLRRSRLHTGNKTAVVALEAPGRTRRVGKGGGKIKRSVCLALGKTD